MQHIASGAVIKTKYVFGVIGLNIISHIIISSFEAITEKHPFKEALMSINLNYGYVIFFSLVNILFFIIVHKYQKNKKELKQHNVLPKPCVVNVESEPKNTTLSPQYLILLANMKCCGKGAEHGVKYLSWDFVAKIHINTTKPLTILFNKCAAELKHNQYKDITSNFHNIFLLNEEHKNNAIDVYGKFRKLTTSQIVINRPYTITLLAMFETSYWEPRNKESATLIFKLPISENGYKSIQINIPVLKVFGNDKIIKFKYFT